MSAIPAEVEILSCLIYLIVIFNHGEVMGMTLVKWEPFRDLITMQDRMSRLFDETLSRVWKEEGLQRGLWSPPVDIVDREHEVILKIDLPEMSQSEIDIKVEENTLTIKGERKFIKETPEENFHPDREALRRISPAVHPPERNRAG